jgi:hypothetical protein
MMLIDSASCTCYNLKCLKKLNIFEISESLYILAKLNSLLAGDIFNNTFTFNCFIFFVVGFKDGF